MSTTAPKSSAADTTIPVIASPGFEIDREVPRTASDLTSHGVTLTGTSFTGKGRQASLLVHWEKEHEGVSSLPPWFIAYPLEQSGNGLRSSS